MLFEEMETTVSFFNIDDLPVLLSAKTEAGDMRICMKVLNPSVSVLERLFKAWHSRRPVPFHAPLLEQKGLDIATLNLLEKRFEGADLILEAIAVTPSGN